MKELRAMLIEQLRDAYSAEEQAIQGMKRAARKASEPKLQECIEVHIEESETHRERIEQALEQVGSRPGRRVCEAMRGLVEEAQHDLEDHEKGPLLDLVIVAGQQRVEHYEIAAYGTMAEYAKAMGEKSASVLGQILSEEKRQDERLTDLTRRTLLPAAMEEADEALDERSRRREKVAAKG